MKHKILNILSILYGLLLINGGLNKFFFYMPIPDNLPEELVKDNEAIMEIAWLMPLIGLAEVVGGALIIWPKTRPLGILVVIPVMVGVMLTHLTVAPDGLPMVAVIWAILLWNIVEYKDRYMGLIR